MGLAARKLRMTPPAAGGGVSFTESFNTANSDTLGPDLTWTETTGDLDVVSNRAQSTASFSEARAEHDVGSADMYAEVVCYLNGGTTSNDNCRVLVRFDASARTHYGLLIRTASTGGNHLQIYKRTSGAFASLLEGVGSAMVDGDVLRFEVSGTSLVGKVNGATVISTTDSSISTGSRGGIATQLTNVQIDNFEVGAL